MQWNYFLFMKIFIIQFFNSGALQTYDFQININIFQTVGFKSIRQSFVIYIYIYILQFFDNYNYFGTVFVDVSL